MKRAPKKKDSSLRFIRSKIFWMPFGITLIVAGLFFAWELGAFEMIVPTLAPRPSILPWEFAYTGTVSLLLALTIGLAVWQNRFGACPRGIKRLSGFAAFLGAFTLICPACVLLPVSLIGVGFFLASFGPYLPILRALSIILLVIATMMLWPRRG